jgi:hypothetical protein
MRATAGDCGAGALTQRDAAASQFVAHFLSLILFS